VGKLRSFIEAKLELPITVRDLARLVGLSEFYFARTFRRSFHEAPHAYITRRRIERAQALMLSSCASLAQIAMDCGLCDQSHFTRVFRRVVGNSPAKWRRGHMTEAAVLPFKAR
jgi:AraC-like DNA-binding protein